MAAPTQSKLTKGDTSTNGFEWVCGRLKIDAMGQKELKDSLAKRKQAESNMIFGEDQTDDQVDIADDPDEE